MTYVSWAALYEGDTDRSYLDVLIPSLMEDLILSKGIRHSIVPESPAVRLQRGPISEVAKQICESQNAFHLCFIHTDTGGRNVEQTIDNRASAYCREAAHLCNWPCVRCIIIAPRHETEAWVLADPEAIMSALGYQGDRAEIGLPANATEAERLSDPKSVLTQAIQSVRGRRRPVDLTQLMPAVAQRQSLSCLRQAQSFLSFQNTLAAALVDIGCLE